MLKEIQLYSHPAVDVEAEEYPSDAQQTQGAIMRWTRLVLEWQHCDHFTREYASNGEDEPAVL